LFSVEKICYITGKSSIDILDWKNNFDFNINRFPIILKTV